MKWVLPVEAYPRYMRDADNDWSKHFYCERALIERNGDEYTLNWIVRATNRQRFIVLPLMCFLKHIHIRKRLV